MKISLPAAGRKRAVNLTLSEGLVNEARALTDNLSAVVEALLSDYVVREAEARCREKRSREATVAAWNHFGERCASFADEYSTL